MYCFPLDFAEKLFLTREVLGEGAWAEKLSEISFHEVYSPKIYRTNFLLVMYTSELLKVGNKPQFFSKIEFYVLFLHTVPQVQNQLT